MNESMFSQIDLIRQDSKDVRDFVKKVFSDREFKSMSKDTDFIKYLKSIYEGTHLDEEHVKFSNRTQNGTITTGSVQITNETIKEDQDCWDTHKVGNPKTKISSKTGKRVNNCVPKSESVVNEAKEPEVITQLRKIVKDKQNTLVVDTKSKKKVRVDMQSANVMVQVYDALKQQSNKDKFVKSGIVGMGHMAYKLMKNEGVNEGDGLWANIRAKKARGEKPAHKNSKAHKDAVKAGNKINKDESVNEAKAFVVMFKVKKNINNKSIKPTSAAYSSEADAKKFLKSVEKDGGNGMIVRSNTSGMKTEANDADTYFKSATQAVEFAKKAVEKKGFTIDEDDWQTQIALGGRYSRLRPSVGKTHSFSVGLIKNGKPQRKGLSISLFGMDSGKFELTHYIN